MKVPALVAVPAAVVTEMRPVVAPAGTTVTISVAVSETMVAGVPLKATSVAPERLWPVMVTLVPTEPNGRVALWAARALRPDVAIMDLRMPEVGGIEATRRIRTELPSIQVVILTAYDEPLPARSALDVGAFAFMAKDGPPHLISETVSAAWRHARGGEAGTLRRA